MCWVSGPSAISYTPLKTKQLVLLAQDILRKGLPVPAEKLESHKGKGCSSREGHPFPLTGDNTALEGVWDVSAVIP